MCGVVGIIGTRDAAREAFLGLTTLQHRGQDAAGILTYDHDGFHSVKNIGLVENVFSRDSMNTLTGDLALGHARYSTIGQGDLIDVQPFLSSYPYGIGLVHNGNLVNYAELAKELKDRHHRHALTHSDSEVLLNFLADGLSDKVNGAQAPLTFDSICDAVKVIYEKVSGSYSVVAMIAGMGLIGFRDPFGIRPLVLGKRSDGAHMLASESVALSFNGYEPVSDLEPGEVVFVDLQGKIHRRVLNKKAKRHCMFEWVYFASPESVIDGAPVYGSRIELGKKLGKLVKERLKKDGLEADLVVPVPETSRIAAIALSEELGIPYREVLIKNRYIKRTFIMDSQDKREKAVNLKLSPVRSEIEGKKILLVDDSIVRGTTSKKLIELVRKAGATQVYFVSTCPPIQHPCYYGIDFPSGGELIAHGRNLVEIEKEMGADAVIYMDLPGLKKAIIDAGVDSNRSQDLCMACLTGEYPTDISAGQKLAAHRTEDRQRAKQKEAKL